ncbi:PP2C family protein-serine/threonine phosphatase [Streptomyces albogriseolus]|uniref:PP2C family protein-serine/threonine phosphatase n=2 Tax=Streptomyces TaxID=1883 RepID=UPI00225B7B80|nr:PP2C family protein-serine/threonine phosphatase [Streptomyces viridodiastaticus]MCX4569445.1 serine/threonine-protein phosphatase [Streptomyces viridodiastaticus]
MEQYRYKHIFAKVRWSRCLPAAVLLAALVIDLAWPEFNTFPLLAAVPVIAAPLLSLAWTITSGAAACLVGSLLALREGHLLSTRAGLLGLSTIAVLTVVAAFLNRMFAREREQLRTSREVAEAVQRAVLPAVPDRVRGLAVATRYQAAQKEALIGGDLYAVHDTPYGLRMVIGDVRGKGMQAVTMVNTLLGTFHAAALQLPDLPSIVRGVEVQLQDVKSHRDDAPDEGFVTAVVVESSPDQSVLLMANRGHPAPLLVHEGKVTLLEPREPSLPLGLGDLAGPEVPVDRFEWPPGATLVMFTDGIVEARDRDGVFFDPVPALSGPLPQDPGAVLDTMLAALFRHTDELEDDAAALAVTRVPVGGDERDPSTAPQVGRVWK